MGGHDRRRRFTLNDARAGETTFTVTNPVRRADRVVFEVVPGDGADAAWFSVAEPQRLVRGGASVSYLLKAAIPPEAPAGQYEVQARVYSADTAPEESSVLSSRVLLEVKSAPKPEKKKFPWWIVAVAGLVVLVIGLVVWLVTRPDGPPEPPTQETGAIVTVPDITTFDAEKARDVLEKAGLTPGVSYRYDPAKIGSVTQSVPAGLRVARGSVVDVVVAVDLKPPTPSAPIGNATVPAAPPPTLRWTQPEDFVGAWRIEIFQVTCYYANATGTNCTNLIAIDEVVKATSYRPVLRFTYRPATATTAGVYHSGTIAWRVSPVDAVGTPGPASPLVQFQVAQ
ncbi:PASTA domain-containing protein [Luedemannella flava]